MGVTSAGRGFGTTFFFELPVYGPDYSQPAEKSSGGDVEDLRQVYVDTDRKSNISPVDLALLEPEDRAFSPSGSGNLPQEGDLAS
jgi:hypothetical protein